MECKFLRIYLVVFCLFWGARAQDCSKVFRLYRNSEGIYAEVVKSNTFLEPVLRLEVTMSVAVQLQSV